MAHESFPSVSSGSAGRDATTGRRCWGCVVVGVVVRTGRVVDEVAVEGTLMEEGGAE